MLKRLTVLVLTLTLIVAHVTALPTTKEFTNNREVRESICSDIAVTYVLYGTMGLDEEAVLKMITLSTTSAFDDLTPEQKTDAALYCMYLYGYYAHAVYSKTHTK